MAISQVSACRSAMRHLALSRSSTSSSYEPFSDDEEPANARKKCRQMPPPMIGLRSGGWLLGLKRLLKDTVRQCTYGKDLDALLAPNKGFKVISTDGDVLLRNYGELPDADSQPPFKGVCNELAYKVGVYLQNQLGQEYAFSVVKGQCDDFFPNGIHYFLLMWPKQEAVENEAQLTKFPHLIPSSAILIDPSFKRVLMPDEKILARARYRVEKLLTLEDIQPNCFKDAHLTSEELPTWLPVGFVQDLLSHVPSAKMSKSLVFLGFQKGQFPGDIPYLDLKMQDKDETLSMSALQIVPHLPPEHPLKQLHSKISSDLDESWMQHLESLAQGQQLDFPMPALEDEVRMP